jgi:hypothetical protein
MTSENHFGVKTTTQEKKNEDDLRKDRIKKTPFFYNFTVPHTFFDQ